MLSVFFIGHRDAPEALRLLLDKAVERHISEYMKSEGRTYADHAATLRLWMEREKGKTVSKIPDYTHKEGESL